MAVDPGLGPHQPGADEGPFSTGAVDGLGVAGGRLRVEILKGTAILIYNIAKRGLSSDAPSLTGNLPSNPTAQWIGRAFPVCWLNQENRKATYSIKRGFFQTGLGSWGPFLILPTPDSWHAKASRS